MSVRRLSPAAEAGLRATDLTYREAGHTLGTLPTGYRTTNRSRELTATSYEAVALDLMRWRIHERAGLQVRSSGDVTADAVVVLRFGWVWPASRHRAGSCTPSTKPDDAVSPTAPCPGIPSPGRRPSSSNAVPTESSPSASAPFPDPRLCSHVSPALRVTGCRTSSPIGTSAQQSDRADALSCCTRRTPDRAATGGPVDVQTHRFVGMPWQSGPRRTVTECHAMPAR